MKYRLSTSLIISVFFILSACGKTPEATPVAKSDYTRIAGNDRIIVQCATSCTATEADLVRLGAKITARYQNVAALAVTLPLGQLSVLSTLPSVKDVAKSRTITLPRPTQNKGIEGRTTKLELATLKDLQPQLLKDQSLTDTLAKQPLDFAFDNVTDKAAVLHKEGQTGKGVIVGVIDTGTANNATIVPALAGSVIGGETFITGVDATEPSATSTLNDAHGTMTGTMIAGHAAFVLPNDSTLVKSLKVHAPNSIIPVNDTTSAVPMIGSAPEASLYALKVFSAIGGGADTADVLAAMDRTITLKRNFDAGKSIQPISGDGTENKPFVYSALNIQVVSMSLGGAALFPGFEADDLLTLEMLKAGIVIVVSAGNDGPNAMTNGNPATGFGAISVAAANDATHVRVAIDVDPDFGLGQGIIFRPTDHLQTAVFSSRGPTADGRIGIHITANGVANFVQSADGGIFLVDGTSFSAPTVAGAAALLRGAYPTATAAQVREALISGANSTLLGDRPSNLEQGNGFLDVVAARDILKAGTAKGEIPRLPPRPASPTLVQDNITNAGVAPVIFTDDAFTADIKDLMPGQVAHFFVSNPPRGRLKAQVTGITPALSADKQNQLPPDAEGLKGDLIMLAITDAPTSFDSMPLEKYVLMSDFVTTVPLSAGVARVAIRALSTNAGKISAKLTLTRAGTYTATPVVATGSMEDAETDVYRFRVPSAAKEVTFDLSWRTTWAYYPTHDIDLLLIDPDGFLDGSGATLTNPERFTFVDPPAGNWSALVDGYMLHGSEDRYRLGIADQNGKALETKRRSSN